MKEGHPTGGGGGGGEGGIRGNREINFEKSEQLLPFWKLTECELIFSTPSSERTLDNWILRV